MNIQIIYSLIIVIYIYYITYYVRENTVAKNIFEVFLFNKLFLFLSVSFISLGLLGLYNKNITFISKIFGFLLPISLVLIEI